MKLENVILKFSFDLLYSWSLIIVTMWVLTNGKISLWIFHIDETSFEQHILMQYISASWNLELFIYICFHKMFIVKFEVVDRCEIWPMTIGVFDCHSRENVYLSLVLISNCNFDWRLAQKRLSDLAWIMLLNHSITRLAFKCCFTVFVLFYYAMVLSVFLMFYLYYPTLQCLWYTWIMFDLFLLIQFTLTKKEATIIAVLHASDLVQAHKECGGVKHVCQRTTLSNNQKQWCNSII